MYSNQTSFELESIRGHVCGLSDHTLSNTQFADVNTLPLFILSSFQSNFITNLILYTTEPGKINELAYPVPVRLNQASHATIKLSKSLDQLYIRILSGVPSRFHCELRSTLLCSGVQDVS
jgi:hypothetical protein